MHSVQARPSKRVKDLSRLSAQKLLVRVNFYYFIYLLLKIFILWQVIQAHSRLPGRLCRGRGALRFRVARPVHTLTLRVLSLPALGACPVAE